jgi:hypothetical protein
MAWMLQFQFLVFSHFLMCFFLCRLPSFVSFSGCLVDVNRYQRIQHGLRIYSEYSINRGNSNNCVRFALSIVSHQFLPSRKHTTLYVCAIASCCATTRIRSSIDAWCFRIALLHCFIDRNCMGPRLRPIDGIECATGVSVK